MTDNLPSFSLETAIEKAGSTKRRGAEKAITHWLSEKDVADYDRLQKCTRNAFGKYLKDVISLLIQQNINKIDKAA